MPRRYSKDTLGNNTGQRLETAGVGRPSTCSRFACYSQYLPTMLFSKDYVGYLAREVSKKLIEGEFIETPDPKAVTERINAALLKRTSPPWRCASTARSSHHSRHYSDEMAAAGQLPGNVQEAAKNELVSQVQGGAMNPLSKKTLVSQTGVPSSAVLALDGVEGGAEESAARRSTSLPMPWPKSLATMDQCQSGGPQRHSRGVAPSWKTAGRGSTHRRCRPAQDRKPAARHLEGSQEWDILYRKYYNEEVKKLGI